jgi:hypothetical protein
MFAEISLEAAPETLKSMTLVLFQFSPPIGEFIFMSIKLLTLKSPEEFSSVLVSSSTFMSM